MYSRILEARSAGATHLDLEGYDSNIEVVVDSGCRRAQVEAYADVNFGSTVEEIDKLALREAGGSVELHLPESAGGGMMMVSSFGSGYSSVQIGSVGRGMTVVGGTVYTGGGDGDVVVNGQRIQVRGGKTYVNGVLVDGADDGAPIGDPPATIHLRATLPPGSTLRAKSYNGNVRSDGVGRVNLKTYNGNVRATGLTEDSKVKSYNGTVTVGSDGEARPAVMAETYNGDIQVLDDNVRVRPKTYNGDVRYPR